MVTDHHRDFMRALCALAREHRIDNVRIDFRLAFPLSSDPRRHLPRQAFEQITASWSQGRHGAEGEIRIETRDVQTIPEHAPKP